MTTPEASKTVTQRNCNVEHGRARDGKACEATGRAPEPEDVDREDLGYMALSERRFLGLQSIVTEGESQMDRHTVIPHSPRRRSKVDRAVYTVKEAAELLGLSLGSTYSLVRLGEIPARQLGGRWVIPKQRFHAWLEEEDLSEEHDMKVTA